MTTYGNTYLLRSLKRILGSGIYIENLSDSEKYLLDMCDFFNKNGTVFAYLQNHRLILEDPTGPLLASVRIQNNTLSILPLSDANFFNCFLDVLRFTTKKQVEKKEENTVDENEFEWV